MTVAHLSVSAPTFCRAPPCAMRSASVTTDCALVACFVFRLAVAGCFKEVNCGDVLDRDSVLGIKVPLSSCDILSDCTLICVMSNASGRSYLAPDPTHVPSLPAWQIYCYRHLGGMQSLFTCFVKKQHLPDRLALCTSRQGWNLLHPTQDTDRIIQSRAQYFK
jgi:hypothetical protein